MGRYHGLMTDTDREYVARRADVTDAQHYQAVHRVRSRIEELPRDIEVLEEHHPKLLAELREIVCEDDE